MSSSKLSGDSWTPVHLTNYNADEIVAVSDSAALALTAPLSGTQRFFKVEVADIDTDLDGLTDWSERRLSLDPQKRDSDDDGETDGARVKREMGAESIIRLEVLEPLAYEDSDQDAVLAIVRSNSMRGVKVGFGTSGAALIHSDYTLLKEDGSPLGATGVIDLPAGKNRVLIRVNALEDSETEGGETGTLTLTNVSTLAGETPSHAPQLGAETTGTFIISHSDKPLGTGLRARYYNTASPDLLSAANMGQAGVYSFTRSLHGGEVSIPYSPLLGAPPPAIGDKVRLSFTTGGLVVPGMTHLTQAISAISPTGFTVDISPPGVALPQSASGDCFFAFQDVPHPADLERVDSGIDFDWGSGSPVAAATTTSGTPIGADQWSAVWETWLHPEAAGSYRFRLDADDKARLLLDTGTGPQVIAQHGWDSPATPGAFVESGPISLNVPASPLQRYRLRVEMVETSGDARCRVQWQRGDAAYAEIPSGQTFTHLQPMTYSFQRNPDGSSGQIQITPAGPQVAIIGAPLHLRFSHGPLLTAPELGGSFTITGVMNGIIQVAINRANLPPSGNGGGFVRNPENGGNGWLLSCFANTSFTAPVAHMESQIMGPATTSGGLFGNASPGSLIQPGTFSVSWSGHLQPEFSQDYTLFLDADDGVQLSLNDNPLALSTTDDSLPMSSYSYGGGEGGNGLVVVNYAASALQEEAFRVGETVTFDPTTGPLAMRGSSTYNYDAGTEMLTVSYANQPNLRADAFVIGDRVELDPDSGSLADLERASYTITGVNSAARTFTVNQRAEGRRSEANKMLKLYFPLSAVVTEVTPTSYTVSLGSNRYMAGGSGSTNLRVMSKTLKPWASYGKECHVTLPLIADARYDLKLDYHQQQGAARCRFSWFCPSRGKQVVPASRMYPPPPQGTGPFSWPTVGQVVLGTSGDPFGVKGGVSSRRFAFVGEPFTEKLTKAGSTVFSISGLPSWLNYNTFNGTLSGTPGSSDVGVDLITVTVTQFWGSSSSSLMEINVVDLQSTIPSETRSTAPTHAATGWESSTSITWSSYGSEVDDLSWTGDAAVSGSSHYGRVRGHFSAPETGEYYFWIAGTQAATLSISNNEEPSSSFARCSTTGGTGTATGNAMDSIWTARSDQRSDWLTLVEGQKYYFTVTYRHSAGDNFAVGWSKPGDETDRPSQIIPGTLISIYTEPEEEDQPPTQFVASLLPVDEATSSTYGSALLSVNESTLAATLTYRCSGLSSATTDGYLISTNADHSVSTEIGEKFTGAVDNDEMVYITLSTADLDALKAGRAYINISMAGYPYGAQSEGEIKGMFVKVNASHKFTVPDEAPDWTTDSHFLATNTDAAVRFLTQATFGPNEADITALQAPSATRRGSAVNRTKFAAWIEEQFTKNITTHYEQAILSQQIDGDVDDDFAQRVWWQTSLTAKDQLRQRVAFALSQILVVSAKTELDHDGEGLSYYYDALLKNAFGNYRVILKAVTLTPAMGHYLDMFRSKRPSEEGDIPNENFARELMQLFSIGLYRQWSDGSYMLDSSGYLIPTYTQAEVEGLAHVFTGWDYGYGRMDGRDPSNDGWNAEVTFSRPMRSVPPLHFTGEKLSINNVIMPGMPKHHGDVLYPYLGFMKSYNLDESFVALVETEDQKTFKALAETELDDVIEQLFNHPNVGPFVCRQLIQRLVTSHPSAGYVYRVVQEFEDNGSGERGDMQAVIKAILLDSEARSYDYEGRSASSADLEGSTYGKQREPLLRVAAAARAFRTEDAGGIYSQAAGSEDIVVTLTDAAPSHLAKSGTYWLDFEATGGVEPKAGAYKVTAVTGNTFTTTARSWLGPYTRHEDGGGIFFNGDNHKMGTDASTSFTVYLTAQGGSLSSGLYTIKPYGTDEKSFTFTADPPPATDASDAVHIHRLYAGIESSEVSSTTPTHTLLTVHTGETLKHLAEHGLVVGDTLTLKLGEVDGVHGEWTVVSVTDNDTLIIEGETNDLPVDDDGKLLNDFAYIYPHCAPPSGRSGSVNMLASTYRISQTDEELDQAPLSPPSVFSWYHPGYQHSGALGATGATVPEFQRTTDTTVINQLNFFAKALYPTTTPNPTGVAWFSDDDFFREKEEKAGDSPQALALDFTGWTGLATSALGDGSTPSQYWTDNANMPTLISRLMTLLNVRASVDADRAGLSKNANGLSLHDLIVSHVFLEITAVTATASAAIINTSQPHGYNDGDQIYIKGAAGTGSGSLNGLHSITFVSDTQFSIQPGFIDTGSLDISTAYASSIEYDDGSSSPEQRDARLRAILHLIFSSPDFIIQR